MVYGRGQGAEHDQHTHYGEVPEWLKGADCKSVGLAPTLVRIQPPPPVTRFGRNGWPAGRKAAGARAVEKGQGRV